MLVHVLASVFVVSMPTIAPADSATADHHFQLVIDRTPSGWSARCDSGCRWTDMAVSCATDCDVLIDASGVSIGATTRRDSTGFAFVLAHDGNGGKARSLGGTRWGTLEWGCGSPPSCRVKVDQDGVWWMTRLP